MSVWDAERTEAYAQAFFYAEGSALQQRQFELITDALALEPHHRVADIGGGTGSFSQKLHARGTAVPLRWPVLCVEPSPSMVAKAAMLSGVATQCSGADEFTRLEELNGAAAAAWPITSSSSSSLYDRVLMKEVVHLLRDPATRQGVFLGIFRQLSPGGRVCIFTRPHEPSYPLVDRALEVWKANQPAASLYIMELETCGFTVTVHLDKEPVVMPKAAWLGMLQGRVWSTFSCENFDDAQLATLVEETEALLQDRYAGETACFDEEYVVITAQKPQIAGRGVGGD